MAITTADKYDKYLDARSPWVFKIGKDFQTNKELLEAIIGEDAPRGEVRKSITNFRNLITECTPEKYLRPNQSDTSLGGNDVINPLPQFCRTDDIIHPLNGICGNTDKGMGRVYSEVYDKNQQMLYMTFGVPQYTNLKDFYFGMINKDLANLVNKGEESTVKVLAGLLGKLAGGAALVGIAINFPILPIVYLMKKTADAIDTHNVTKYYEFKAAMPLFYRYCNSIMCHLAVNLGLFPNGTGRDTNGQFNQTYDKLYGTEAHPDAIPDVLKFGPDMYRILAKRDLYLRADGSDETFFESSSEEYLMGKKNGDDTGFFSTFTARINAAAHGADKFIAYRLDKNVDTSESVSNQSGESSIHQLINSKAASARDMWNTAAGGNIADIPGLGALAGALTSFASNAADTLTMGATVPIQGIMTGQGVADMPEVWQGSSFSKSYSFSQTFRSVGGDPVSIFQSVLMPLIPLLVAALPRSVGENAYTAPFLIRAYAPGQVAIPCGMIDSMTIRRGASEFGWSSSMLPTVVQVDFTIKDLSPVMHMALMDSSSELFKIFSQNSTFQEYLLTLSGMGLEERLLTLNRIRRKWDTSLRILRSTYGNSLFWATQIGNSSIPRLASLFSPYSRYSQ